MISKEQIEAIVAELLAGGDLFPVEVKCSPSNEIEVVVDADRPVGIDDCVALSRQIEGRLDREAEDFELSVFSAGLGQPFRLLRQYRNNIGNPVEVVTKDGRKLVATLTAADEDGITVEWEEKEPVEGSKRKQFVSKQKSIAFGEIKKAARYIDFK